MLPAVLIAAGAGMGAAGLAGAYASGSMGKGPTTRAPSVNQGAYQWGGRAGDAEVERARLENLQAAGRADAASARGLQGEAADLYRGMASGKGPSAGQAMLAQGMQRANADAANLAASARGGGGAQQAAMRRAVDAQAAGAANASNQAAMLRAQEQQAGIAGLAASGQAMRSADMAAYQGDLAAGYQVAGQQLQAQMAAEELRARGELWAAQQNAAADQASRQRQAALWGGLMGGGSSMMSMGMGGKLWPGMATRSIRRRARTYLPTGTAGRCALRRGRRHSSKRAESTARTRCWRRLAGRRGTRSLVPLRPSPATTGAGHAPPWRLPRYSTPGAEGLRETVEGAGARGPAPPLCLRA